MLKRMFWIQLVLALLVLTGSVAAQAKESTVVESAKKKSLVGSWVVTVTPDPATGIPPIVNFSNNTKDGRVFNVDPLDGAGVGEWKKTGSHKGAVTFMGFTVIDGTSMQYKVRGSVQLSTGGNEFNGTFLTEIYDSSGAVVFAVPGTVHGVRFKAESL